MTIPLRPSVLSKLADQPLVRLAAYYVVLAAAGLLLYRLVPDLPGLFTQGRFDQLSTSGGSSAFPGSGGSPSSIGALDAANEAVIAMACAYLLMLPVAWVYILTRRKRGYQQSLVQTLVILPIVVSGVVILVKSSIALAFSLGGIVGAIAFRNRLEDTKDAVHVFLAIGVGLACGVQVVSVAVALSVFYNVINLTQWWTDFGRMPADLAGVPAQRRLEKLRASPGRRSDAFVSEVDSLILKSMTPDQLAVLAERAQKRRRQASEDIGLAVTGEVKRPKFDADLRVTVVPEEMETVRRHVESTLASQAKYWQFKTVAEADQGRKALLYRVRYKKKVPSPLLLEAVRRAAAGRASVDLS